MTNINLSSRKNPNLTGFIGGLIWKEQIILIFYRWFQKRQEGKLPNQFNEAV